LLIFVNGVWNCYQSLSFDLKKDESIKNKVGYLLPLKAGNKRRALGLYLNQNLILDIMQETTILWADDEIDLLKPHILFLNEKGYKVTTATNGRDALDAFKAGYFDLVFLDENMPGLTGLETLAEIKNINADVPVC
jgi:PleD family two-component response regulator